MTISPLRPNMYFTDQQGSLTKEAYDFLQAIFLRLGGSLANLNAASLENATWEAPNPIGSTTPNTVKTTQLTITNGVTANAAGFKHKRVAASVGASTSALITVTWSTAFADTNYTVVCSVQDSTAATASAVVTHIESVSASAVTVRVNNTAAATFNGTLHIIGVHD